MLDKKGRLFGWVSVVDLFAVVMVGVIAVVVMGIVSRAGGVQAVVTDAQPLYVTFVSPQVHDFTVANMRTGGTVLNNYTGILMGEVLRIDTRGAVYFMADEWGRMVASPMAGHYAVQVTSRVVGQLSDGALLVDGHTYFVGSELQIWVGDAVFFVYISHIREALI